MHIINAGICGDGGTRFIQLECDDGSPARLIGLDCRIPTPPHQRRIFLNAEHPLNPNAQILPIGSKDEMAAIELLSKWADQNLSDQRRESLMNPANRGESESDFFDSMALSILLTALDRTPPPQKKRILP